MKHRIEKETKPKSIKRLVTVVSVFALATGLLATGAFAANAATTGTGTQADPIIVASTADVPEGSTVVSGPTTNPDTCAVTTLYSVTTPGKDATSHTEYRYQTRVKLYGSKEVKSIKGWHFVSGSTTTVNNVHIPGHWAQGDSGTFYPIPDVVINAVWGSGGVPDSVLGDGTVNLSVYGGGSHTVSYHAEKVTTDEGYTAYSDWSDWSTDNPGAGTDLKNVETRTVSDDNAVAPVTTYYQYTDTSNSPCAVQEPDPQPCVVTGASYDEDASPVVTQTGLLFSGPSVPAVDRYWPATGNLQGITGQSITYGDVGGYHASLVFEAYRFANSTGYMTVTAEPYQNGWVAGQTGTFTVNQSTLVWTSKIANSDPGSQANPIALSDFAALFPDNQLISVGIHLGTNSVEGQYSLVTAVSGCLSVNEIPVAPEPKLRSVVQDPVCSPNGGGVQTTLWFETDSVWSDILHQYVDGVEFPRLDRTSVVDVGTGECPGPGTHVIEVNPPTSLDVCGVANDTVTVPSDTQDVTYTINDKRVAGVGTVTVTATLAEGDVVVVSDEEVTSESWSFDFTNVACNTRPTPPSHIQTGDGSPVTPYAPAALLALLAAGSFVIFRRKNAAE